MRHIMFIFAMLLALPLYGADIWVDVDTAVTVPVNKLPLVDDDDGITVKEAIAYDESGMDLDWVFQTTAGVTTVTAVTPTTGGVYDWTHLNGGIYKMEIPASGGGSINNDTEGFGWFVGHCDDVCPWAGPIIGFRHSNKNDLEIDDGTAQTNQDDMFDGTGYACGTTKPQVALYSIDNSGGDQTIDDLEDFADSGYDPTEHYVLADVKEWLDTACATPTTAGVPEVDVTYWIGQSDSITNADDFFGNSTAYGKFDDTFDGTKVSGADLFSDLMTNANVEAEALDALESVQLDHLVGVTTGVAAGGDLTTYVVDGSIFSHILGNADTSTFASSSHALTMLDTDLGTIATAVAKIDSANELRTFLWGNTTALRVDSTSGSVVDPNDGFFVIHGETIPATGGGGPGVE